MYNEKEFEFLGIKRWHKLGYKGKGIIIASHEKVVPNVFDDVFVLKYGQKGNDYDEHGTLVMDYIRQVAPEATKWSIDSDDKIINGKVESEALDFLLENTPHFLGTANHSGFIDDDRFKPYYQEIHDKGCFLVCSAGNKRKEINKLAQGDLWKAVGACDYNGGNPKVHETYVDGEEMDFVSFHNLYSSYNRTTNKGTSFSYEIFMGMCGLVQGLFLQDYGELLTEENLLKFVIDNCMDLEDVGKDIKTGYGLFRLPEPTTLNPYRYIKKYKGYEHWREAIEYLTECMDMDSPRKWIDRIVKDNDVDFMWFVSKWANAFAGKELTI